MMRVLVCSVSVFVYHSFARGASCNDIEHRYFVFEKWRHYLLSDSSFILGMTSAPVHLCFGSEFSAIWTSFVTFTSQSFLAYKPTNILQQNMEEKQNKRKTRQWLGNLINVHRILWLVEYSQQ